MNNKKTPILVVGLALVGLSTYGIAQQSMANGFPWNLDPANSAKVTFNQTPITFSDAQPEMVAGHLLVPIREVAEQTGSTVSWNDEARTVDIDIPDQDSVTLTATSSSTTRRKSIVGPKQIVLINGRAYMSIEHLASAFSGSATWTPDGDVTITAPDSLD